MIELTLITSNAGKVAELSRMLQLKVHGEKLDLPELQSTDVGEVARAKAQAAYDVLGCPVVVDDTGLIIEAWGELPGALITWFLSNVGNEGIIKMLDGLGGKRDARVVTALGYCDRRGVKVFGGELKGSIAKTPRGSNGFGYDPIFIPAGYNQTFAELTAEQKDTISMRAIAAKKLRKFLEL